MSHSRIFELSMDRNKVVKGDWEDDIFDESFFIESIPGCDYVVKQDEQEFLNDIEWFSEVYNIPIKIDTMGGKKVGIIDRKGVEKLRDDLIKDKHNRIEKIRSLLKKGEEDIDMWDISYVAYQDSNFYFIIVDSPDFNNEMDLLKYYLRKDLPDEIFIVGSYDYHI